MDWMIIIRERSVERLLVHSNVMTDEFKPCLPFIQKTELADSTEENGEENEVSNEEKRKAGIWRTVEYVFVDWLLF